MEKIFSEEELKDLSKQLSCPSGKNGLAVGKKMNKTNFSMILATIQEIDLINGQSVLELGPGNGAHLDIMFDQNFNLQYWGLEVSKLMKEEAEQNCKHLLSDTRANFSLYDGLKLPFDEDTFDVIFTVNTLYFWKKPIQLLNDIHRVLKKGGTCYITFVQKKVMKDLPFAKKEFRMYDNNDIKELVRHSPFHLVDIINKTEEVKSKIGETIKRDYAIVCLVG